MAELRLTPAAMHDLENIKEYISVTRGAAVSTFSPTVMLNTSLYPSAFTPRACEKKSVNLKPSVIKYN